MKQVINEKLIKRNKKLGNILSIVGISILAAGLILNINATPTRTLISFGALIIGFIISQISTYYVTRFGRNPRFDEIISDNLSKLNNSYTFYVYCSPIPMLLLGPSGLWIPVPVSASGEIYFDKKWKQRGGSFFLKLFGQENIGRPALDIEANENQIIKHLKDHLDENQLPPINSILVSMHPKATIGDVEDAPNPIIEAEALRRKIRKIDRNSEIELSQEMLDELNQILRK